jgi:hypothetical protein
VKIKKAYDEPWGGGARKLGKGINIYNRDRRGQKSHSMAFLKAFKS